MLVSHRKRFIYLKTIKTASTSVESYFEQFCLPEGTWRSSLFRDECVGPDGIVGRRGLPLKWYRRKPRFYDHMSAARVRRNLPTEVWDEYFKFCVVRNPFERVVSAFHFFEEMDRRGLRRIRLPAGLPMEKRFRVWVRKYLIRRRVADDRACFTIDNQLCVDDVIRYESLESELQRIGERLEIAWKPQRLRHMVKSDPGKRKRLADYYDHDTRQQVAQRFRFELDTFGYTFPE